MELPLRWLSLLSLVFLGFPPARYFSRKPTPASSALYNAAHMPSCWKAKPVPIPKKCQPLSPTQLLWKRHPNTPVTPQTGAAHCIHLHHRTTGYTPAWLLEVSVGSCVFMLHQQDKSMADMEVFPTVLWKGPCPSKVGSPLQQWAPAWKGVRAEVGRAMQLQPCAEWGLGLPDFSCPKRLNGSFTTKTFTSLRWEQGTALNSCLKSNCC